MGLLHGPSRGSARNRTFLPEDAVEHANERQTKPAHYYVILDEIRDATKLGADALEQITHNLCYLHGTTTSAVSICPPAYYADKICERGRCYLADYISSKKPGEEFDYNESPWRQGVHERYVTC